jgi:hypothetical protein
MSHALCVCARASDVPGAGRVKTVNTVERATRAFLPVCMLFTVGCLGYELPDSRGGLAARTLHLRLSS